MQYIFVIFIIFYELFRTIFCPFALNLPQKAPNFPFFTISGSEQMFCKCIAKVLFKCRKINFCVCLFYIGKRRKGRLPPAAGLRVRRYFRHLQICRTAANAAGRFRLSCEKGGGTAYAVTEVLAGIVSLLPPNSPSVACVAGFPYTTKDPPPRRDFKTIKASFEHLVNRRLSEDRKTDDCRRSLPHFFAFYNLSTRHKNKKNFQPAYLLIDF